MEKYKISSVTGKLILLATICASAMAFLDGTVVNIAIPVIQSQLHATITQIQWIINGYTLMLSALILISGSLGDRFGRKRNFIFGIVLFTAFSFLCSISQTSVQLITFRVLQGIGGAMMIPGSLSIIDTAFEEKIRGKAIGIWSGFAGGIAALGPFIGGWLVQTLGWQSVFFINIPIGIITFFIALRFVPESRNNDLKNVDISGSIFILIGLFCFSFGLIQSSILGWSNPFIIGSIVVGIITFIGFWFVENKVNQPLIPLEIFKSSLVRGANLSTFFLYFALSGLVFFLVLNLQQVQHYSPLKAGLSMLPSILLITFLSGPAGSLSDKIGPRIPMIVGPLFVSIGMVLLIIPGTKANYFIQYLPGLGLFGFGMAIVIAPLTKSALSVNAKYSGAASGINNSVSRIASLLAVALLGAIAVSIFTHYLTKKLDRMPLSQYQHQKLEQQTNKLMEIEIPNGLNLTQKKILQNEMNNAFIYSFRWIMGINALLAFLSAVIASITIHNPKQKL